MRKLLPLQIFAAICLFVPTSLAFATGALFVRPLNSSQTYQTIWIKTYDATVAIQDQLAETHVDQRFMNETNAVVEATYVFPLPEGWERNVMFQQQTKHFVDVVKGKVKVHRTRVTRKTG